MADYQDDERGLMEALSELEPVRGTFPPVYMADGLLIGYDKLENIRVIAAAKNEPVQARRQPEAHKTLIRSIVGAISHLLNKLRH